MGHAATDTFPKGALIGAGLMIALTVTAAATARWTGFGALHMATHGAVETVDLVFEDRPGGAIAVRGTAESLVLEGGTNGFVRGVLRGLARDRKLHGIGPDVPFRLIRRVDGRLVLEDPATSRALDLGAYGSENAGAFARLLHLR